MNEDPTLITDSVRDRCRLYGGTPTCPDADESCRTQCVHPAESVAPIKRPFVVTIEVTVEAPDAGSAWCWVDGQAKIRLFDWPVRTLGVHLPGTHIDGRVSG